MSHADTLERRICPVCKRFPAGYADSDVCLICGADTVPVSEAAGGKHRADATQPATRAPRPRAERSHPDSGGGVFFPFDGDRPERKPVWPYVLAVLGAALFITVYFRHESPQPQQALQPEIESQRGYDSGAVVAPPAVAAANAPPQTATHARPTSTPATAAGNAGGESIADSASPEAAGTVTSAMTDAAPARPAAAVPAPKAETPPAKNAVTASEMNIVNSVRYSLKQGDLTDARERFERLRQGVQARPEGRQVSDELIRRERERDAALQRARYCEAGKDWSCMAQNAAHAKDLDSGSAQSQVMLSMATSQLRWARNTRPAPSRSVAPTPARPVAASQ
ncbi:hypothetical protein [Caballeronia telluris]|uniref:Uncharacterized protein n=1 Tax=Caballeronia telluris TaxID=326475 RepID=A0A158FZN5_9BURK|nr:hypothetical protein [Caballeronia telluris]SAL25314.1 hypothetical protein AWB66_01445 [Caballeronia telluris]